MKKREVVKVEKGVPMPAIGCGRPAKYPWATMLVGECFVSHAAAKSTYPQAAVAGLRHDRQFRVRASNGVVRVWRVK